MHRKIQTSSHHPGKDAGGCPCDAAGLKPCSWTVARAGLPKWFDSRFCPFRRLPATPQAGGGAACARIGTGNGIVDPSPMRPVTVQLRDDGRNPDAGGDGSARRCRHRTPKCGRPLPGEQRFVRHQGRGRRSTCLDIDLVLKVDAVGVGAQANAWRRAGARCAQERRRIRSVGTHPTPALSSRSARTGDDQYHVGRRVRTTRRCGHLPWSARCCRAAAMMGLVRPAEA